MKQRNRKKRAWWILLVVAVLALGIIAGILLTRDKADRDEEEPEDEAKPHVAHRSSYAATDPTPSPTEEPEPTAKPTPEPTPEVTPESTPEPTPEATPEATLAPTPEPTPEGTPEPTPEPTPQPTPEPEPTPTPEPTPEPGPTAPTLSQIQELVAAGKVKTKSDTDVSLVLPTESQMLTTPFRAKADSGSATGSIYIMPKPESGHGHTGTVPTGTELWIVAETKYYYFFVTDDGLMGWNGKSYFSF